MEKKTKAKNTNFIFYKKYKLQIFNSILMTTVSIFILTLSKTPPNLFPIILPTQISYDLINISINNFEKKVYIQNKFNELTNNVTYSIFLDNKFVGNVDSYNDINTMKKNLIKEICSNYPKTLTLNNISFFEKINVYRNPTSNISNLPPTISTPITLSNTIYPLLNYKVEYYYDISEQVKYESEYKYVSYMNSNEYKIEKAGLCGLDQVKYSITEINGMITEKNEVNRTIITLPKKEIILIGTQPPPILIGSGIFDNPLPNSEITSRFGPRWNSIHTGTDFYKPYGSDIFASDNGTVIFADWYSTYGYLIEIDHGNGWSTRYAHCSDFYVNIGDNVTKGQIIAAVGTSGYSTGPHLHFEIRYNEIPVDPLLYIDSNSFY